MQFRDLIEILTVVANNTPPSLRDGATGIFNTTHFLVAEQDVLFLISTEHLPEDSIPGKYLKELGAHVDDDYWALFI